MTLHTSSEEKKLLPVYEPSKKDWTGSDLIFVSFSELPPLERLRVIQNLLRTGASRSSSAAKGPLLQDAIVSPPTTPLSPVESTDRPHFPSSTPNEHAPKTNLLSYFS